jgi:hypothetical protein
MRNHLKHFGPDGPGTEMPQDVGASCGKAVIETTNRGSLLISVNYCKAHFRATGAVMQGISSPNSKKSGEQIRDKHYGTETIHQCKNICAALAARC